MRLHGGATRVERTVVRTGPERHEELSSQAERGHPVADALFSLGCHGFDLRFNERTNNDAGRFDLAITGILGKRLTYANLIGSAERI